MRKYALLVLAATLVIACKKEEAPAPAPQVASVVGKWRWVKTFWNGPLGANNPLTPNNTSETWLMEYTSDGIWRKFENGIRTDSGTYAVTRETTNASGAVFNYDRITYKRNNSLLGYDPIEFRGDTLGFAPHVAGGYTSLNVRYVGGSVWFVK